MRRSVFGRDIVMWVQVLLELFIGQTRGLFKAWYVLVYFNAYPIVDLGGFKVVLLNNFPRDNFEGQLHVLRPGKIEP